jgi:hypothetical protein
VTKVSSPCAHRVDNDFSSNFSTQCLESAYRRPLKQQLLYSAVRDHVKTTGSGLCQEAREKSMNIDDPIGWAEARISEIKPAQKRKSLPGFRAAQKFERHELPAKFSKPFSDTINSFMNQV